MVSAVPGNPSENEEAVAGQDHGFQEGARLTGQTLRNFGFQVIAFLLGIALAFM